MLQWQMADLFPALVLGSLCLHSVYMMYIQNTGFNMCDILFMLHEHR